MHWPLWKNWLMRWHDTKTCSLQKFHNKKPEKTDLSNPISSGMTSAMDCIGIIKNWKSSWPAVQKKCSTNLAIILIQGRNKIIVDFLRAIICTPIAYYCVISEQRAKYQVIFTPENRSVMVPIYIRHVSTCWPSLWNWSISNDSTAVAHSNMYVLRFWVPPRSIIIYDGHSKTMVYNRILLDE